MERHKQFDERYLMFGVAALRLIEFLPKNKIGSHVGDQLFRSATSPGAHLQEARAAESRADFIHKMTMALKEIREAKYWLELVSRLVMVPTDLSLPLLKEADELVAILTKSVVTAKSNTAR